MTLLKIPTSKIIKFGKGMAIVLPPEYVKEKNLKVGDIMKQILESEKNIAKGKIKKLKF